MPYGTQASTPGGGSMQRDRITRALLNIQNPPPVAQMPPQQPLPQMQPMGGSQMPPMTPQQPMPQMNAGAPPMAPGTGAAPPMGGTPGAMPNAAPPGVPQTSGLATQPPRY